MTACRLLGGPKK